MTIKAIYMKRFMLTAFDENDAPVEEYTGPLADIGPKMVALGIPYERIVETITEGGNLADLISGATP